jgi:LDH2 family malate/lactate/ureidoglycolate dehydrogenase
VDANFFAPNFAERLDDLAQKARDQEPADSAHPVLFPGDPEVNRKKACEQRGDVIAYHPNQIKFAVSLINFFCSLYKTN